MKEEEYDEEFDEEFEDDEEYEDADDLEERLEKSRGNPRQIGKHSLKVDEIFRSTRQKKKEKTEFDEFDHIIDTNNTEFSISDEIHGEDDENNISSINYYRVNKLKDEIKKILETYTEVKMNAKRRKPSQTDFNAYFNLVCKELSEFGYMKTEIFVELAGYFTLENYWNIFKLLDKEYADIIIEELKNKYGIEDRISYIDSFF